MGANPAGDDPFTRLTLDGVHPLGRAVSGDRDHATDAGQPGSQPAAARGQVEGQTLGPDPFDQRGVYPMPTGVVDTLIPSFTLYPLIVSAGSDGEYGILADADTAINYATRNLIPFAQNMSFQMMGTQTQLPNESDDAWLDNIHNHQLNLR